MYNREKEVELRFKIEIIAGIIISFIIAGLLISWNSCSIDEEPKDMSIIVYDLNNQDMSIDKEEYEDPPLPEYNRPTYGVEIPHDNEKQPWDDLIAPPIPEPPPCIVCK